MKNLEKLILRQVVFMLIPLPDMVCRAGKSTCSMPMPLSLAGMK